jgi:hypothetical protein
MAELLARLHGMLNVSRVGSFDTRLASREPYFLRSGSSGGDASSRISFDEAVLHYGKMALRKRLGADTSEAVLCELTSWPLQSLDYTCDHLSKAE